MKRHWSLTVFSLVVVLLCSTSSAHAQFGSGIVYDPTNYASAVARYGVLVQQLEQMQQQFQQLQQEYQLLTAQKQLFEQQFQQLSNIPDKYKSQFAHWQQAQGPDTFNLNANWIHALNAGSVQAAQQGYKQAAVQLQQISGSFANLDPSAQQTVKNQYANVELLDGATVDTIATVGDVRSNSTSLESTLMNLETDVLSTDPADNTQTALLQKNSVANYIIAKSLQDTNKLLAAQAALTAAQLKQQRDAEAALINDDANNRSQGYIASQAITGNGTLGASLQGYSLKTR
jgi:hypothetical protein